MKLRQRTAVLVSASPISGRTSRGSEILETWTHSYIARDSKPRIRRMDEGEDDPRKADVINCALNKLRGQAETSPGNKTFGDKTRIGQETRRIGFAVTVTASVQPARRASGVTRGRNAANTHWAKRR